MWRTIVTWINKDGEERKHTLFDRGIPYAKNWWRESIAGCQGILTDDEAAKSKLKFVSAEISSSK